MQNDIHDILSFASIDTNLSSNEFRLFYYLINNIDSVLLGDVQKKLNFKTYLLLSKSLKKLLDLKYLIRTRKHTTTKNHDSKYIYSVNMEKPLQLHNINYLQQNDYFSKILSIYDYFFKNIKTNSNIDIPKNKKAIDLLLNKDNHSVESILTLIDFVALFPNKYHHITRPLLFRQHFNELLTDYYDYLKVQK